MTPKYKLALLFLFLGFSGAASACKVPKPGFPLHHDELIQRAETIVLVRLNPTLTYKSNGMTRYKLETVQTLKGNAKPSYEFVSHSLIESDNDFGGHTAKEFWEKPIGRSEWPCCLCGPDHTFRPSRLYLFFPDKLGAIQSAEAIHSEDDQWLKYVRSKVKTPPDPSFKRDTAQKHRTP